MIRIAAVAENGDQRKLLHQRLSAAGYPLDVFETVEGAVAAMRGNNPDLVLSDRTFGERIAAARPDLAFAFLTPEVEIDERMGVEFWTRGDAHPRNVPEKLTRVMQVKVTLREAALLETGKRRVDALESLSLADALTGVWSRRYLELRFAEELTRSTRYLRPLSCLMVDVDNFRQLNDSHGSAVGDLVLVDLAVLLKKELRAVDVVARFGGEEFVLVFPETPLAGAVITAERMRARVEAAEIGMHKLKVTISLGVANDATEDLLVRADRAMRAAKRNGKNRVEAWDEAQMSGDSPR